MLNNKSMTKTIKGSGKYGTLLAGSSLSLLLCLLSPVAQAQASVLSLTLTKGSQTISEGTPFVFYQGTLTNTGPDTISLDSDGFTQTASLGAPTVAFQDDGFFALPFTLNPGMVLTDVPLFSFSTGTAPAGSFYLGNYFIRATDLVTNVSMNSYDPAAPQADTPPVYSLAVTQAAAVPEADTAEGFGLLLLALASVAAISSAKKRVLCTPA